MTIELLRPARAVIQYDYHDLTGLMSLMNGHSDAEPAPALDVLWVLYDRVLQVSPQRVDDDERDRFFLSKGNDPKAYYAVLAAAGFIEPRLLTGYGDYDSPLGLHPDRVLVPGVEASSTRGHGLPLAVGTALGLRARGLTEPRLWVMIGDGEIDEGANQEALSFAGHAELNRLNAVVVDESGSAARAAELQRRFASEGWSVQQVDGHDHDKLELAFAGAPDNRPHAVVARVRSRQATSRS
ncbi:transketolase [Amycolatopsis sp. lyj-112]|uniref:transketolase n=1 Tax=Amycolatopsis sp. lyj-112 TaxID=2789288 RepID=UPI00397E386B